MGRKFSKKISKKILLQGIGLFIFFATATTLLLQNCSQVSVSDMTLPGKEEAARILRIGAGEVVVEVGASQYDKAEAQFNVGLDTVPALKQMWIVDNSGTMVANNLNLASSFGAMFDQSNQDSLFKFDTTAYLFSTAQTIPSYQHSTEYVVAPDIADRQAPFFNLLNLGSISETNFNPGMRTADLNSGMIPGDNVGISVKRNSTTDFVISAAPVLSKKVKGDGSLELTSGIYKPANTNTVSFENEFRNKLSILQSTRVPSTVVSGTSYQQSSQVIDRESGLCGVARILSQPNGMFSPSDLLAFTIVTDENDNDPNGAKCFKRTGKLTGEQDVINGECWEYETGFKYIVTTMTTPPTTCNLTGKSGYVAKFSYTDYSADVKYRILDVAGGTTYKVPQTKISWEYARNKQQARRTKIVFRTETNNATTYQYSRRLTKLHYYTKNCVNELRDGISTRVCTPVAGEKTVDIYGDVKAACTTEAAKIANAITAIEPNITASYLPKCDDAAFSAYLDSPTCSVSDSTNCRQQVKTPQFYSLDATIPNPVYTADGDYFTNPADCNAQAFALNAKAVVTNRYGADKMPVCTEDWYDRNCTGTVNCRAVADTNGTDSKIVLGTFTTGTTGCTDHAMVAANAIKSPVNSVKCTKDADTAPVAGNCPATYVETYGCVATTTQDSFKMSNLVNKPGFKTRQDCVDWAKLQSNQKIVDETTDVSCVLKTPTAYVRTASLSFADIGDTTTTLLSPNSGCGIFSSGFYSKLSTTDQAKVAPSTCLIESVTDASKLGIALTAASCEAQKDTECTTAKYRLCQISSVPGTPVFTPSAAVAHVEKLNMKATCSSKCNQITNGFCETWSDQDITISEFFNKKYGNATLNKTAACDASSVSSVAKTEILPKIEAQPVANSANFCPRSSLGVYRYFVPKVSAYRTTTIVDQSVSTEADLIAFIKKKIKDDNLNVNFTVFIRRTGDPVGTGSGIDYTGTHYERLVQETGGQAYAVAAPSYGDALKNLSSVIKSKLIRGFTVAAMQPYQVITSVTIIRTNGEQKLAIGEWTQNGKTITIGPTIQDLNEGDKVVVQFQNNDGYIKDQLKKMFVIDEMRPDQIVLSVEHIKASGETVLLNTSQWLKEDNKISIDPSVVINGGDQFRIKFKNNTTEE